MNNPTFFNELKKKLMNSEYSDFFATFLTFNEKLVLF